MKNKLYLMILLILIWVSIVSTSSAEGTLGQNVTITIPTEGQKLNTSNINVIGTASENVTRVEVSIENGKWQRASGTSSWKATITLSEGSNTIYMRAIDKDKNIIGETSLNVTLDTTLPVIAFTSPIKDEIFLTSSRTVTLTASDNDLSKVEVKPGNGDWQAASFETSWNAPVTFSEGSNTIYARAIDTAGNTGNTSVNVTLDTIPPTINIKYPAEGDIIMNPAVTINGTASEDVSKVEVKVGNGDWIKATGKSIWGTPISLLEGLNTVYARAIDTAGNSDQTSVNVTLNTKLVTITINSGAEYTNMTEVNLSLTSPARWMSFSNDYSNWTDWELFTSAKSWTLASVDDMKLVHFSVSNRNDIQPDHGLLSEDSIILDTTMPEVTALKVSTSTPELNKPVDMTAKVSDKYLDTSSVFFFITSPDGNRSKCMTGIYTCNFINTSGYGRYNVTILAGDLAGNTNNTEKTWFITTMKPYDSAISTIQNNITEINAIKEVNTTLEIFASQNINGNINIILSNDIPPEINQSIGSIPFKKFIAITTNNPDIEKNLNWMNIKIYYIEEELKASGLDENSLRIFYLNKSRSMWETPSSGVNTTNTGNFSGYVWANVSGFSTFGLSGSYPKPSQPVTSGGGSSSGGGGGGGGGGGASGEKYTNIEVIEKYDLYIFKNKVTEYKFKGNKNPILFVNITGNVNAGEITTIVEVLRNTSYLVKTQAPGFVYKNMNIWVGNLGFSTSLNIKRAVILFKVENSWLERNNLAGNEITLAKWNGIDWITLETSKIKMDSTFTYFEANSDSFSPFAITALKGTNPLLANITSTEKAPVPIEKVEQPEKKPSDFLMNWFLIIGIFLIIGLIVEMIVKMKNK
ncbi:MAG: PGF-pre-PGF domain-containing protein [Candidatus Methanoperedens sp.]|nr:PGF-pre-PGF domain-containing protein [Candidatus Methanoperedens sp.]